MPTHHSNPDKIVGRDQVWQPEAEPLLYHVDMRSIWRRLWHALLAALLGRDPEELAAPYLRPVAPSRCKECGRTFRSGECFYTDLAGRATCYDCATAELN